MVVNSWTGISSVVPVLPSSCGGSRAFGVSSTVFYSLLVLMTRSISVIAYGGFISMSVVTSMSSIIRYAQTLLS